MANQASKSTTRPSPAVKDAKALELWVRGSDFSSIATDLGFRDESTSKNAVIRAMKRDPNLGDSFAALDSRQLELLREVLLPKALGGDEAAADLVLTIDRQVKRMVALAAISSEPLSLAKAVAITVEAAPDVDPELDAAIIVASKKLAERIDAATAPEADPAVAVKALYLLPHLNGFLKEMLATPAARKAVVEQAKEAQPHGNRLVEYQERARKAREGGRQEAG